MDDKITHPTLTFSFDPLFQGYDWDPKFSNGPGDPKFLMTRIVKVMGPIQDFEAPIITLQLAKSGISEFGVLIDSEEYKCVHDRILRKGLCSGSCDLFKF